MKRKMCKKCETEKPATADFFHRDSSKQDGCARICKKCKSTYDKAFSARAPTSRCRDSVLVAGFVDLYACPHGQVYRRNKRLALRPNPYGYHRTQTSRTKKGDSQVTYSVHRLVAMCFLKNYSEELTVNHRDGNKSNNDVNNLEMVTAAENVRLYYKHTAKVKGYAQRKTLSGVRYYSNINISGAGHLSLGTFSSRAKARAGYCKVYQEWYGYPARLVPLKHIKQELGE